MTEDELARVIGLLKIAADEARDAKHEAIEIQDTFTAANQMGRERALIYAINLLGAGP